jgi:hypothetical protein
MVATRIPPGRGLVKGVDKKKYLIKNNKLLFFLVFQRDRKHNI